MWLFKVYYLRAGLWQCITDSLVRYWLVEPQLQKDAEHMTLVTLTRVCLLYLSMNIVSKGFIGQ